MGTLKESHGQLGMKVGSVEVGGWDLGHFHWPPRSLCYSPTMLSRIMPLAGAAATGIAISVYAFWPTIQYAPGPTTMEFVKDPLTSLFVLFVRWGFLVFLLLFLSISLLLHWERSIDNYLRLFL